jgi:hypothetical protein
MKAYEALLREFPGAALFPDSDEKRAMVSFGRVAATQLFRLELKRPWLVDDGDRHKAPKKPWPDAWCPTLWVGSSCGYSPGTCEEDPTLEESVKWLRNKVDEVILSLGPVTSTFKPHPPMPAYELGKCRSFRNWDHFCVNLSKHAGEHQCLCGVSWSTKKAGCVSDGRG